VKLQQAGNSFGNVCLCSEAAVTAMQRFGRYEGKSDRTDLLGNCTFLISRNSYQNSAIFIGCPGRDISSYRSAHALIPLIFLTKVFSGVRGLLQ
jgi:hypothetical protein